MQSDRAVHDGGGFFAFALSQSASPVGMHASHPTCIPPLNPGEPAHKEHDLFPQSPDDIMQRIHDNSLDAAAAALESFSVGGGFGAQQPWQRDMRAAAEPELAERPQPPRGGFMMHPRAQSWHPTPSSYHAH